jgi:hypothetical protein
MMLQYYHIVQLLCPGRVGYRLDTQLVEEILEPLIVPNNRVSIVTAEATEVETVAAGET